MLLAAAPLAIADGGRCSLWPAWDRFKAGYLSDDGRIVDPATPERATVSEAEAYTLLLSLVAGDRATFARVLQWTQNNLAAGDLGARLPAWRWGLRGDGAWGVIDDNSAADADAWLAYALLEAGRLWHEPRYAALGSSLLDRIARDELVELPGMGPALLPGPRGFVSGTRVRLNPSYMPLQVLRRFAAAGDRARWSAVADTALQLLARVARGGLVPDWFVYDSARGAVLEDEPAARGSYDAIRVYLWAGMLPPGSQDFRVLLRLLRPMARRVAERGAPPEWFEVVSGRSGGDTPPGYAAALLPLLGAAGLPRAAARERARAAAPAVAAAGYYAGVLGLMGLGYAEGRFGFGAEGQLRLHGGDACTH